METVKKAETDIRLNNLTPWKPGQSGNPNGRTKKEFSLTEGMREFLVEKDPLKKQERKELLIDKTYQQAMKGDISAIKLLWNYLEGMPKGSETQLAIQVNVNPEQEKADRQEYEQLIRLKEAVESKYGDIEIAIKEMETNENT